MATPEPEVSCFSPEVSCFSPDVTPAPPILQKVCRISPFLPQNLKNRKRKLIFSQKWPIFTGSSSVSAGSKLIFQIFKASRALWQKVAKFCHRKRKWGPEMLKNHVFWKKRALLGKKFEIYKTFSPPNRKLQAFYCVFAWQYFQISSKVSKIFFFRSKNPVNLRGFCPPNRT